MLCDWRTEKEMGVGGGGGAWCTINIPPGGEQPLPLYTNTLHSSWHDRATKGRVTRKSLHVWGVDRGMKEEVPGGGAPAPLKGGFYSCTLHYCADCFTTSYKPTRTMSAFCVFVFILSLISISCDVTVTSSTIAADCVVNKHRLNQPWLHYSPNQKHFIN